MTPEQWNAVAKFNRDSPEARAFGQAYEHYRTALISQFPWLEPDEELTEGDYLNEVTSAYLYWWIWGN